VCVCVCVPAQNIGTMCIRANYTWYGLSAGQSKHCLPFDVVHCWRLTTLTA